MIYTKNLENNQNKLGHCFKWMWCIISKLFAIELKKKNMIQIFFSPISKKMAVITGKIPAPWRSRNC